MAIKDLTVYLCAEQVQDFADVILESPENLITWHTPRPPIGAECRLAVRVRGPQPPEWSEYLGEHFDVDIPASQPVAAVLFVRTAGRVFAITFGQGHHVLRDELLVSDFGIKATANDIDPDALKGISSVAISSNPRRTDQLLGQTGQSHNFGSRLGKEWIRTLAGRSQSSGRIRRGGRAFTAHVTPDTANLRGLDRLLRDAFDRYRSTTYQDRLGFIDQVKECHPRAPEIAELDERLASRLRHGNHAQLGCAVPDEFFGCDGEDIVSFQIHGDRRRTAPRDEITLSWLRDRMHQYGSGALHDLRIRSLDAAGNTVADRPLHQYLTAEMTLREQRYVLFAGKWWLIDRDFYAEVRAEVERIPDLTGQLPLPDWWTERDEPGYNRTAAQSTRLCLLDRDNFRPPGERGSVEIADLLTEHLELVCVKRLSRSATMSHLFSQGSVSARLYSEVADYQAAVARHFRNRWPQHAFPDGATPVIVYAMGTTRTDEPFPQLLPFFSRVNLCEHVASIRALRPEIGVGVARISMVEHNPDVPTQARPGGGSVAGTPAMRPVDR